MECDRCGMQGVTKEYYHFTKDGCFCTSCLKIRKWENPKGGFTDKAVEQLKELQDNGFGGTILIHADHPMKVNFEIYIPHQKEWKINRLINALWKIFCND